MNLTAVYIADKRTDDNMKYIRIISLILILSCIGSCKSLRAAKKAKGAVSDTIETLSKLKDFNKEDLEAMTPEELIATLETERKDHNVTRGKHNDVAEAHKDEKDAHAKTKQKNGTHLSLLMSLIFWIGGPVIIGAAIALKTYLYVNPKPIIITGIIFTCMPILINVGNDIAVQLGDWFILLAKIVSGIAVLGAIIYSLIKYKHRIARLVHYGQYATKDLDEEGKKEFNKGFAEDAEAKGLSHCKDDKKLISGVKNILDKAVRAVKK